MVYKILVSDVCPVRVPPSTWTHAAVSFDGSQATFSIDGNASGGGAWSNTPSFPSDTNDSMVLVGAYLGAGGAEGFYTGKLDEVAIVDRAFSTSEITTRLKDAHYNLNDQFVRPGEDFFYKSVIENLLNSRFAYGLLKTFFNPREAITDWMNKLLPRTFQLKPDNPVVTGVNTAVISDTLHIADNWTQSGKLNIKQTVTAQIVDQRAESNFAELWLKFNENVGATDFADSSGNMPPRDVECTTCPTSGESGMLNNSVKFNASGDTPVPLPDLEKLDLIQRGYTVALWVKPASTSLTSPILTLLKSDNNRFSLRIRKNTGGQYVPQVYMNGSDVTPGMNSLWRVMIPDVWNHLVVRYSNSDQRLELYLNGARAAVFTGISDISSNDNFYLGGATQDVDYWVDDLRLFNRPLSVLDINRLAERPVLQLQMDGSWSDSSVYGQSVSTVGSPSQPAGSVRGSSLQPGSGPSMGYLSVNGNGNSLLNMQDGAFSYAAWIYPTSGGTGNDWEGIFGYDSGTSSAYPVLERKGARLRFGFGNGSDFESKEVTADVLNLNQWNHVVVTYQPEFDLNGVPTGNYLYKLYVNSVAVDSNIFNTKPTSAQTLFVGHSSKSMTVNVNDLYVTGIRQDPGDWAEVWMKRFVNGDFQNCFWPSGDCDEQKKVQGTNTYDVGYSTSYSDYQSVRIEVWESDAAPNPDDHCGDANYSWYELPSSKSTYMEHGIDGYLHT
jgi:hypothetical protein